MPAGNVTLYAQWTKEQKYTVTYKANGGTNPPADPNSPYYAGVEVTVLGQESMTRTNYTFTGWNTASDGSGTPYTPGDKFTMPAGNVTLYAQWTQCCNYDLHKSNANWGKKESNQSGWDVHVEGLIKGNNCRKSLEVVVKIYDSDVLQTEVSLGRFTPNQGGNISFNSWVVMNEENKPSSWKYQIIIKDTNGVCEDKATDLINIDKH